MRQTIVMVFGVGILVAASGCGTIANLNGRDHKFMCPPSRPPLPFGGVINDVGAITEAVEEKGVSDGVLFLTALSLVDLPFSLGADVVTLPWATYEFWRERRQPTGRYRWYGWNGPEGATTPASSPPHEHK